MRFERLRRSRFFGMIKLPLLHLRNFVTAPVLSRVDSLQGVLATHQRLIAQTLEAQKEVEALTQRANQSLEKLMATEAKLNNLEALSGGLHTKSSLYKCYRWETRQASPVGRLPSPEGR